MIDFSKNHFIKAQKELKVIEKINANLNVIMRKTLNVHYGQTL